MKPNPVLSAVLPYIGLIVALAALIVTFSLLSDSFLQRSTFVSIANQIPDLTFIAIGMTFVLIAKGIDLSVGSLMALGAASLGSLLVKQNVAFPIAIVIAVLVTTLCGFLSGIIAVGLRIPSFIVTLGMLEIGRGLTKVLTESKSIFIGSRIEWFAEPVSLIGLSPAFLTALTAVIASQFLLSQTVYGKYLIAIGTNEEAVRMSGIRTWPYLVSVFAISGGLCAMGGWSLTSRLATVDPNAAVGLELSAIAACVIGGTSLMGGRGTVIGTFLGVIIMQVLQRGLAQMGVDDANKQIITGFVIVVAVLVDAMRHRFATERTT
ncbi:MAG: ABC transporter permease [Pirellula sp.]|jgi:ribose transport system permease protein